MTSLIRDIMDEVFMSSLNTLFPVTIFQEKIIFFGFVFLLGVVSILGATFGATPSIFFLFAAGHFFPRSISLSSIRQSGRCSLLTVLFERFFTLQPFISGKSVFKAYPIDMIVLGSARGALRAVAFVSASVRRVWPGRTGGS
jgi:hypothetical protein